MSPILSVGKLSINLILILPAGPAICLFTIPYIHSDQYPSVLIRKMTEAFLKYSMVPSCMQHGCIHRRDHLCLTDTGLLFVPSLYYLFLIMCVNEFHWPLKVIQERLSVLAAPRRVRSTFFFARLRSAGGFYSSSRDCTHDEGEFHFARVSHV